MPSNNQVHLRGEVAERPYFDLVPARDHDGRDRIAFLRVVIWVQRDANQPQPEDRLPADQMRVVAYGRLAEALRNKIRMGDWLVVKGWIQTRKRPNNGGTVTEIVANEIDHFMRPLVPDSVIMRRLEQVADRHEVSMRAALDQLLTFALDQADGNPVILRHNGQHAE